IFSFWFWFSLSGNVCRSPSVPGNSGRSSRKFLKRLNFFDPPSPWGFRLRARLWRDKTAWQATPAAAHGRNCRACASLARGLGKETRITRMVTNLETLQSIGVGQFVRVCERSRWDQRHRRKSREGERRESREASEFQIRVPAADV